jgi:hypothetical protein
MSDVEKNQEDSKNQQEAEKSTLEGKSVGELLDIIKSTRNEAKERRLSEKELKDKLAQLEAKLSDDEQAKKIAEGKKDEVILELQQKLKIKDDEYKPFIDKATKYDEYDSSKRNQLKEVLKDKWLPSFDNIPLIDLETLASQLSSGKKLLDTDNGKSKQHISEDVFSLEELKHIQVSDYTDEKIYDKVKRSMEYHNSKRR